MTNRDLCSILLITTLLGLIWYPSLIFAEAKPPASKEEPQATGRMKVPITLGGKTIQADVADTDELLRKGLLGRETISENEGMLLFFPLPGEYAVHMEGMKFPIDAIWIDDQDTIKLIYESIRPDAGMVFPSMFRCKYCLEVKAGFCKKFGVKVGQKVRFGVPGN